MECELATSLPSTLNAKIFCIITKLMYTYVQDNSAWTLSMDREILEWISKEPQDWWQKTQSTVYTWGKGSWNQLGTSTRENSSPALAEEWKDVQQVTAMWQ